MVVIVTLAVAFVELIIAASTAGGALVIILGLVIRNGVPSTGGWRRIEVVIAFKAVYAVHCRAHATAAAAGLRHPPVCTTHPVLVPTRQVHVASQPP
jgi:hypothetical protein